MQRGALIVLEGLDRSGKTTQVAKLVEHLQQSGVKAQSMRFPDRTLPSGIKIDSYLSKTLSLSDMEVHRLFSLNRWERMDIMLKSLQDGITLVVDRYAMSGVAYSAAKATTGMDAEWCKKCDEGLLAPDKVLYFKMTPEATAARGGFGAERYETEDFQAKVAEQYEGLKDETWVEILADKSIEEVHRQVLEEVQATLATLKQEPSPPLVRLWDKTPIDTSVPFLQGDGVINISRAAPGSKNQPIAEVETGEQPLV